MTSLNMMRVGFFSLGMFLSFMRPAEQADWANEITERALKEPKTEDVEWADYINELQPAYDESGFPEITTRNPADNFFSQRLNFSLTGRGEAPYIAIIYQFLQGETELDGGARSGVRRNRACGGVLVSSDRLITPCGCVISYFGSHYAPIKTVEQEKPWFPFDLGWKTRGKYLIDGRLNRIFVQYGLTRFYIGKDMPGYEHPLEDQHLVEWNDKAPNTPLLTVDQECYEIAKSIWFPDGRGIFPPSTKRVDLANHALALVPFWPEILHSVPGQFIPWPPKIFNDELTETRVPFYEEQIVVIGMGYEKKVFGKDCPQLWRIVDDEGNDIPLDRISINIPMKHCVLRSNDLETCKRSFTLQDQWLRLSCFCDLFEPKVIQATVGCKVIYGGTIGWPIVYNGNVVGLTVSERNPQVPGNRLLGSSLAFPSFMKHVEETLTKEQIWKQRTERPPMFREDVEHWSVVFYEYPDMPQWYVHMGTTPRLIPFALAEHLGPHPAVSTSAPLVSLITYFIHSRAE